MNIDFDHLWKLAIGQFHTSEYSIHGPDHWRRVERNGMVLASRTGADIDVVRLFAVFHDCRRLDDAGDEGHGARGAEFAQALRGIAFALPDDRFELLRYACIWHTEQLHHADATIGTCWDADRLDLGRVGAAPKPEFMSTEFGREIADFGSLQPFIEAAGLPDEFAGSVIFGKINSHDLDKILDLPR